jgi:hypothetical protein
LKDHSGVIRCLSASPLLLLLILPGCAGPDLGNAPFLCNKGDPECPEGYVCENKVCVREGYTPEPDAAPPVDRRIVADGPVGPTDGPTSADQPKTTPDKKVTTPDKKVTTPDQPPVSGKIEVSELMINPFMALDSDGEWLELHNTGSTAVDLNGWTLKDSGVDKHVINASVVVPAGGYVVLGHSTSKLLNGGAPVQYTYGNTFNLANTSDEVILLDKSGTTIDSITYSSTTWTIPLGASLSLKKTASSNHSDSANWCEETKMWSGSDGDYGTPGLPGGC